MEEIEESGFRNGIEKNDRIKIGVQGLAAIKKHWSDCVKKNKNFEHHVNRKKQKFDVHVTSILWKKKKSDNNDGVVDCIEIKHEEMMQGIGD